MNALKSAVVCLVLAGSVIAGGCVRAQAKVVPELPALDVPEPPPRIVEVVEIEEPPPLVAEPTEVPPPTPAKPTTPKPAAQQRAEPKPEPPKVEVPVALEPPRPAEANRGQPAGTLQTTPAAREAELERTIRDMLTRAKSSLSRIDYAHLNGDARTQFDQARGFIRQAEDALRDKNLVFAENLADKANTLAAQLAGR